jgi:hypothetical protein
MRNVRFATPTSGKRTGTTAPGATGRREGKTVGEECPTFAREDPAARRSHPSVIDPELTVASVGSRADQLRTPV